MASPVIVSCALLKLKLLSNVKCAGSLNFEQSGQING